MISSEFKIFIGEHVSKYLEQQEQLLIHKINKESDDYILNVNEAEYINYLVNEFSVENLSINFDDVFVSTKEVDVPAEMHPRNYHVTHGHRYTRNVITYHLPFHGNEELLHHSPSMIMQPTATVNIQDNCICIDVVNFDFTPEQMNQEYEKIRNRIARALSITQTQIDQFNSSIKTEVRKAFLGKKHQILKKNDFVASLGIPLKKKSDLPSTFTIPSPENLKKLRIDKPVMREAGFKPEPTLEDSDYQEILRVIFDIGRQFERLPSTYSDKNEETLRDHFLLYLEPRYEGGSATGETFNKKGKTDILLRYQGANAFIAECKFWKGQNEFLKTITKLLSYLTWRDSKAAVIIFVKNKKFSVVLDSVNENIKKHPNYIEFVDKKDESWSNYIFHIQNDEQRKVKLALLLFHIPEN